MTPSFDTFLQATDPLTPANAVAAVLVLEDGRYAMQLRDFKPEIFYPGHWGLFGGAIDAGESEVDALRRELHEELGFTARTVTPFVRFDFDLSPMGSAKVFRAVYEVRVPGGEFETFVLREGLACEALTARAILTELKVTPYDAFAVWLHHARGRFAGGARNAGQALAEASPGARA